MTKITNEMIAFAYEKAKKVNVGELGRMEAREGISAEKEMSAESVGDYITVFLQMMKGEEYRRIINLYATEFYLEYIVLDYGIYTQKKAAQAVIEHVKHYKTKGGYLFSFGRLAKRYI